MRQADPGGRLRRRLGLADAVVVGVGSMVGAGVFVVFAPAARSAGTGLLWGLLVAALVAYCNATSSARLAALYPESGGSYVYGRRRLGEFWGFLAGWAFVVGKIASCAAIALTVGTYVWPGHAHAVAVLAVAALTALNYVGVQRTARVTRVIVAVSLTALAAAVVACLSSGQAGADRLGVAPGTSPYGVLQAAGLMFFAFAGYARIATLGEEVRDPRRTIPRAIPAALGIALAVYAAVAVAVLAVLGPARLAASTAPLAEAVRVAGATALTPLVRLGAAVAALGSLLALILGVSRTSFAMASDRNLPHVFAAVHPRYGVPHRAELLVGATVAVLAAGTDLRGAIGFSSFGVLAYYAVANASAFTLCRRRVGDRPEPECEPPSGRPRRLVPRWVPVVGVVGCAALAFSLPASSVAQGAAVLAAGAGVYALRRAVAARRRRGRGGGR